LSKTVLDRSTQVLPLSSVTDEMLVADPADPALSAAIIRTSMSSTAAVEPKSVIVNVVPVVLLP
jgi:hypothetical protein